MTKEESAREREREREGVRVCMRESKWERERESAEATEGSASLKRQKITVLISSKFRSKIRLKSFTSTISKRFFHRLKHFPACSTLELPITILAAANSFYSCSQYS